MDPYLNRIGIVTLEDIIEEIIDDEIEDEYEVDTVEVQRKQKQQLLALFMQREAGKVLYENEILAVKEFLSQYVTPFAANRMKTKVLLDLIQVAEVLDIESDKREFTHKTDQNAIIDTEPKVQKKHTSINNPHESKITGLFGTAKAIDSQKAIKADDIKSQKKLDKI